MAESPSRASLSEERNQDDDEVKEVMPETDTFGINITDIEEERKKEEITCDICEEKFVKTETREHHKTTNHILLFELMKREKDKNSPTNEEDKTKQKRKNKPKKTLNDETKDKTQDESKKKQNDKTKDKTQDKSKKKQNDKTKGENILAPLKELYKLQESRENQQYIITLATFLAVRYALYNSDKDFKMSVNDKQWSQFGDIVIEFIDSDKKIEIETICCKKVKIKNKYDTEILKKGKLSLSKQCEILEKVRENERFQQAKFTLHTISSLTIDENSKLIDVEHKGSNKKIEIIQSLKGSYSITSDLLNTMDEPDYTFTFVTENESDLLQNFRLHVNQKNKRELTKSIASMIKEKYNTDLDISNNLIRFVDTYFKTYKSGVKYTYNMRREDILLKIAECLLTPFLYIPEDEPSIKESNTGQLWNEVVKNFDITIIRKDEETLRKVYKGMKYILKEETEYYIDMANKIHVELKKIKNITLRSNALNHDGTIHFLYLASWKSGLIPLVLKINKDKDFTTILDVIKFSKYEHLPLNKFPKSEHLPFNLIVIRNDPIQSDLPEELTFFQSIKDLKDIKNIKDTKDIKDLKNKKDTKDKKDIKDIKDSHRELLQKILEKKIKIFDDKSFSVTLDTFCSDKELYNKITSNVLINLLFEEFSIKKVDAPIARDLLEYPITLDDKYLDQVRSCFNKEEKSLSYLVNIKEHIKCITLPTKL